MNEILLDILSVIVSVILLPLLSMLGMRFIKWITTKINNSKTEEILALASNIVINAVKTILQTYVSVLKKNGTFNEESQKIALSKAKEVALSEMNTEVKKYITSTFGDLDNWLEVQIESTLYSIKYDTKNP